VNHRRQAGEWRRLPVRGRIDRGVWWSIWFDWPRGIHHAAHCGNIASDASCRFVLTDQHSFYLFARIGAQYFFEPVHSGFFRADRPDLQD